MFRNFDNWDRYFDRNGNPLHGCIAFFLKDGNTIAPIYDCDQVSLSNPQITDVSGRTEHQVFIEADTVAYQYKYIGSGTLEEEESIGIDVSDQTKWDLQGTSENIFINRSQVEGTNAMGLSTMAALRDIDPDAVPVVDGAVIVCLNGYNEAGDKQPVWYVWDETSTLNDDNGGVIQSDNRLTGRWILVPPTEFCDSRHFGIFPQDSNSVPLDQATGITQLINYCNAHSLRPSFNGSTSNPYFLYTNLVVSSRNPIDVSEGTVFVDTGSSRFYGEWNGNPYFQNANTTVNAKTVRHSWHFGNHVDTVNYIIDSADRPALLEDVNVIFEVSPAGGVNLTRCTVESSHKIDSTIYMYEMEVKQEWFAQAYVWSGLYINDCTILLDNFDSADTYILLKNKQGESDYGDLGEQEINATFLDEAIAENFTGTVTCQGDAELHNATATITFTGPTPTLNAIDCWITVIDATVFHTIVLQRGSITSSAGISVLDAAIFRNVDINSPIDVLGASIVCRDCQINQGISHVGNPVVEEFIGNVFNAQLSIRGGEANSTVLAKWIGNEGTVTDPIVLDRTNLAVADTAHTYEYRGNTGTFIMNSSATLNYVASYTPGTPNAVTAIAVNNPPNAGVIAWTKTVSSGGSYVEDPTKYVFKAKLFSVGTTAVTRKRLEILPSSPVIEYSNSSGFLAGSTLMASTMDHATVSGQASTVSTLLFDEGYTWKVRNLCIPGTQNFAVGTTFSISIREIQ